ncbi:MAG: hypothetical protein HC892_14505 [Saprospiraceae bacterium]|nr:hypothetical protein [Saprospiraceae bacterium]
MERYFKCNKCGQAIARESSKPNVCTSSAFLPVRGICGGGFTFELSKDEVVEQLKKWNYTQERIAEFFN